MLLSFCPKISRPQYIEFVHSRGMRYAWKNKATTTVEDEDDDEKLPPRTKWLINVWRGQFCNGFSIRFAIANVAMRR